MAIQYAFKSIDNFEDNLNYMEHYLKMWEKHPIETDKKYLSLIIKNIIMNGIRSK